jgi:hypothetical protein
MSNEMDDELKAAFDRYEEALMAGDDAGQTDSFWSGPSVVRVDGDGPVTGLGTQTQVWARTEGGWRVIAAVVSPMTAPAMTGP